MNKVFAEVSQYSRESGRIPPHVQLERLENEYQGLLIEKRKLEGKLTEIEANKREALVKVYRRGSNKSDACAATNAIESKYHRDRSVVIRNKAAVEERIHTTLSKRRVP